MQDIQGLFNQIQEAKKEQKDIRSEYKDTLAQEKEYEELKEQLEQLKEKKIQIESRIQQQMGNRYERLEDLKHEVASHQEMLSDIAISTLMDGKTVEVQDEYQNRYEPVYNVKFKKSQLGDRGMAATESEPEGK